METDRISVRFCRNQITGRRKEKQDAEERNNKITVELQMRKRQQEERDKKTI